MELMEPTEVELQTNVVVMSTQAAPSAPLFSWSAPAVIPTVDLVDDRHQTCSLARAVRALIAAVAASEARSAVVAARSAFHAWRSACLADAPVTSKKRPRLWLSSAQSAAPEAALAFVASLPAAAGVALALSRAAPAQRVLSDPCDLVQELALQW